MANKTAFNHQNLIHQKQSCAGNDQGNPKSDTKNATVINDNTEKMEPATSDPNRAPYYDDIYFDSDSEQWQMKPEGDTGSLCIIYYSMIHIYLYVNMLYNSSFLLI